ncbi:sigma factor-like helix-turn-helix DNA-binding protein [Patulibacter defluvii]|uniref:sigma factor-like helix-turn-helix DNA-binding protein n=1 Tax=Patulibacter defluvii TaxID=3095358 RepID=UPI002A74B943|nr:sigma factor-like helix-turn-helix DNA-binding protein [Patulibacter sp. DM4]
MTVAEAAALLPWAQREALALLADDGLGYAEVAGITGGTRRTVAATVAAARVGLADRLGGTQVAERLGRECWSALREVAAALDDEAAVADAALAVHRARCPRCREAEQGLRRARQAYAGWRIEPPDDGWRARTVDRLRDRR